ncbi:hypothetical protein C7K55_00175 [Cyanobium usitatum str. Tous]|uniref:DUF4359 domain-containing protein n=1 Tax=Cyanobium usitatum str. Tous TaxID=2116684 RepID=A0A2P7N162_9CYAN|nr:hypothetical protein C7K55_00175 [Cyanobium usitatum str. Tous]
MPATLHRLVCRSDTPARFAWAPGLIVLGLAAGGLALTNPSPADFRAYASDRLVEEISKELCGDGGLPVLLRMAINNCLGLVQAQRAALAAVVLSHTRRRNYGLLSVFESELGGQSLLRWQVPRFRSTVVGVAGQFVLISAASDRSESP